MLFANQKIKRCSRFVLGPYRGRAACIVFFVTILPAMGMALLLYFWKDLSRLTYSVRMQGQTITLTGGMMAGILAAMLFFFVWMPLWLGEKGWYLNRCAPQKGRGSPLFFLFRSFRCYRKSVGLGLRLFLTQLFWLTLALIPGFCAVVASASLYRQGNNPLLQSVALLGLFAAIGLLLCGVLWANYVYRKYFFVSWIFAQSRGGSIRKAFKDSAALAKEEPELLSDLRKDAIGCRFLSLSILPAFWLLPKANCQIALRMSRIGEEGEIPVEKSRFRARKMPKRLQKSYGDPIRGEG